MGYMYVIGNCVGCGILFTFNAELVPSIPIDGVREPICRDCVARANPRRIANGLKPIWIHPDAYEPQEVL